MFRSLLPATCGLVVATCVSAAWGADDPSAAPVPDYKLADGENHVGFRKTVFTYEAADGAKRERPILIWYPTAEPAERHDYRPQIGFVKPDASVLPGKHPLVLFSHGFLGSADQSIFLTEALARRGYIVAGTNHADSLKSRPVAGFRQSRPNFGDPKSWTDDKYRDRRDDLFALLNHLLAAAQNKDSFLFGRVEESQIGAAGHSLGGYTVLGIAGGWDSWRDERIKAVLALSPYSLPFNSQGNLARAKIPVMLQGGTLDWGISPLLPRTYEILTGPKYYLVLKRETHFGWTNLASLGATTTEVVQQGNPQLITDFCRAFFDRHLRGRTNVGLLDEKNSRLESFEFSRE